MFENCFPADVRHNLWEICAKGRMHSGLYNLNSAQISRKVVKRHIAAQMPGMNFQTRSGKSKGNCLQQSGLGGHRSPIQHLVNLRQQHIFYRRLQKISRRL